MKNKNIIQREKDKIMQ